MSFQPIDRVLHQLQAQKSWQEYQQFQHLRQLWSEIVGSAVAAQTRPVAIMRDVLQVATSNSVWVQELKFKRYRILEQLNSHLSNPLKDIRFSTAYWEAPRLEQQGGSAESAKILWQNHPSRWAEDLPKPELKPQSVPQNPQEAFQRWRDRTQARSQDLPLCPQCQAPTPPGELQRWSVCALCATRQWHL